MNTVNDEGNHSWTMALIIRVLLINSKASPLGSIIGSV
jgi:hypothetical protein